MPGLIREMLHYRNSLEDGEKFDSDWNIHCRPYWIVLHNFQREKKIAATTHNSDGWAL